MTFWDGMTVSIMIVSSLFYKKKKFAFQNIAGFVILSSVVLAIYFYTLYAVKQETMLEEIDYEVSQEAVQKQKDGK